MSVTSDEMRDMRTSKYCKYLENNNCLLLNETCFNREKLGICGFREHYYRLQPSKTNPPITTEIMRIVLDRALEQWKSYARDPSPGRKQMTARPLEDTIMDFLESNLAPLHVQVKVRRQFSIAKGVNSIIDGLLTKNEYPTTLISVKTWLGTGYFRDSFGDAYFAKMMYGRRNVRYYVVTLSSHISEELVDLAKPHIDEVYSLSQGPYIDELVKYLRSLYA